MRLFGFLFRIALLLCLVYLLHRCWVMLTQAVRSEEPLPPEGPHDEPMVRDPECHTHIPLRDALSTTLDGKTLHFCSRECRDAYLARQRMH